jgi:hypothetical protein
MTGWTAFYILCRLFYGASCEEDTEVLPDARESLSISPTARYLKALEEIDVHLTSDERLSLEELLMTDQAEGRTNGMRPMIIIPAFASTRLRVWQTVGCKEGLGNFKTGSDVWLDSSIYFSARNCWINCILLDPLTQRDTPACKSRPDEGLDAITELDPGFLTGFLSTVWKKFITLAASIGFEPHSNLIAVPYDFRLALPVLEKRDGYFSRLKMIIEQAVALAEKNRNSEVGAVVIAHSMGNIVFRYFLEWLKADLGLLHYQDWLDKHIHTFIAGGPPALGAAEAAEGFLSGNNLGLIGLSNYDARRMALAFGSSNCMTPIPGNPNATNHNLMNPAQHNHSVVEVELLSGETLGFSPEDIQSGKMFHVLATAADDTMASIIAKQQEKFFHNDPIYSSFSSQWERPPIRRVICTYGVGVKTPIAFKFRQRIVKPLLEEQEDSEDPSIWEVADTLFEEGNKIYWQSGRPVEGLPDGYQTQRKSGDGTVPYESLSWCHTWLGKYVNITRVPQDTFYTEEDVEIYRNVTVDSLPPSYLSDLHNVFYEHAYWDERRQIRQTVVWEFDGIVHRAMMESPSLLGEVKVELLSTLLQSLSFYKLRQELQDREQEAVKLALTLSHSSAKRPTTDEECLWDYPRARCKWSKYCVYDYKFGDYHLSQSCRLRRDQKMPLLTEQEARRCQCIDSQCISGFCKYRENCEQGVQAFGPSNGWWGPCTSSSSTTDNISSTQSQTYPDSHQDL